MTNRVRNPRGAYSLGGRRAFTLVELLVVIGIIAVLIGILMPVLATVRSQARLVNCRANLRSIGQGLFQYANMNKDRLPNGNPPREWDNASAGDILVYFSHDWCPSAAVFHCPASREPIPDTIATGDYRQPNSARVSYDFYSLFWPPDLGPQLTRLAGKAPLSWDLDGGETTSPLQNHGNKGGNVLYADGHVDWQDRQDWEEGNWPKPAAEYYPNKEDVIVK